MLAFAEAVRCRRGPRPQASACVCRPRARWRFTPDAGAHRGSGIAPRSSHAASSFDVYLARLFEPQVERDRGGAVHDFTHPLGHRLRLRLIEPQPRLREVAGQGDGTIGMGSGGTERVCQRLRRAALSASSARTSTKTVRSVRSSYLASSSMPTKPVPPVSRTASADAALLRTPASLVLSASRPIDDGSPTTRASGHPALRLRRAVPAGSRTVPGLAAPSGSRPV